MMREDFCLDRLFYLDLDFDLDCEFSRNIFLLLSSDSSITVPLAAEIGIFFLD